MNLSEIVPWGRNLSEYVDMFKLEKSTSTLSVLGCRDGPASFNVEATALGWQVVFISTDVFAEYCAARRSYSRRMIPPGANDPRGMH